MSKEEEFDEIMRSKFSEADFHFDEANWDKAEEMIELQRKKERRKRWFFIYFFGLASGLGIFLMLYYFNFSKTDKTNIYSDSQQNVVNKKQAESKTTSKNEVTYNKTELTPDNNSNAVEQPSINTTTNPLDNNSATLKEEQVSKTKVKEAVNNNNTLAANSTNQTKKELKGNNKSATKKELTPIKEEAENNELIAEKSSIKNTEEQAKANEEKTKVKTKDPVIDDNNKEIILTEQNEELDESKVNSSIKDSVEAVEILTDSTILASTEDSLPDSSPALEDDKKEAGSSQFIPNSFFTIDFGGLYNLGWSYTTSGKEANGLSPVLGIAYTNQFKPKFSFNVGLYYQYLNNMNQTNLVVRSERPSFGKVDSITTVETKCLHYAVVPLLFYYDVNPKNSIGLGGSFSYLFRNDNNIIVERETDFMTEQLSTSKSANYLDGFKQFDVSLNLAYKRKLTTRWSLIALINLGLIDIKEENYFKLPEEIVERNLYLRTTLTYKFLK